MITNYDSPDDMPPEMAAYCEHLRQRARGQGCICYPVVSLDTVKRITLIEHADGCPASDHPSTAAPSN